MAGGQDFGSAAGGGQFHTGGDPLGQPAPGAWSSPGPETSGGQAGGYERVDAPQGEVWSASYEAPHGDVGSASYEAPRGDVHEVRATEFEAVRHTHRGPGFRPVNGDGQTTQLGGMLGSVANGRSATAEEVGHWLTREGDEQSDMNAASKLGRRVGSRAGGRTARGTAKLAGSGVRGVRYVVDRRRNFKDGADALHTARLDASQQRWGRLDSAMGKAGQVTGGVGRIKGRAQDVYALNQGTASQGFTNTTTRWGVGGVARGAGIASKAGRGLTKRAWSKAAKPAGKWAARKLGRPAGRAAVAAGQRLGRAVAAVAGKAASAVVSAMATVMSGSVALVGLGVIVVLIIILSIISMFSIQNYNEQQAGDTMCSGSTTLTVPANAKPWVAEGAKTSGLPAAYIASLMKIESDFQPGLTNSLGYSGLLQIGADEWASVGGGSAARTDPTANAHYGGLVLKMRLGEVTAAKKQYPLQLKDAQNTDLLAIAHNAGPGRIKLWRSDYHSSQLPKETIDYLDKLHKYYKPSGGSGASGCGVGSASQAADKKAYDAFMTSHGFTPGDPSLVTDPWGFYFGECTGYAVWAVRNHTSHKDFTNDWKGQHFGNANNWANAGRAAGLQVDAKPAVGAIAQTTQWSSGHVAYVSKVNSDGTFDVIEANFGPRPRSHQMGGRTHLRVGAAGSFQNFIHFEK